MLWGVGGGGAGAAPSDVDNNGGGGGGGAAPRGAGRGDALLVNMLSPNFVFVAFVAQRNVGAPSSSKEKGCRRTFDCRECCECLHSTHPAFSLNSSPLK